MNPYGEQALKLFQLLQTSGIKTAKGTIHFDFLDVNVEVSDKSSVGNLLQEWLGSWMKQKNIYFREATNSQIPPDFYLGEDDINNLLEVKTFDYDKSPNFDIANFDAYVRSLLSDPYRLDADYLIFGYKLESGKISIGDLWLKKVWEITSASGNYDVKTQVKQKVIVNIRPYNFKALDYKGSYPPFKSRKDFIVGLQKTIANYRHDQDAADNWLERVEQQYLKIMARSL
jgi:hypothetical protein